jgi:hypothetical protein
MESLMQLRQTDVSARFSKEFNSIEGGVEVMHKLSHQKLPNNNILLVSKTTSVKF